MSRTLRTAFTVATIALALTACSNPRTAPEVSAEAPATTEVAAPATTEAPAPAEETAAPAQDEQSDEAAAPEVVPAQADEDRTAPAPAAVAEHRSCAVNEAADGGQYMVSGIADNDADGGLVVRAFAGTSFEARTVFTNFTAVDSYPDSAEYPSCLVTADGNVWWEIAHPSLATGGWVNAFYLEPLADDHVDQPEEEEADAHADCAIFYGDDKCVIVYYAAGQITFVEPYDAEAAGQLHLACAYNGNDSACDVLAFVGPGDGIGNYLTQTPTEFLVDDCANLTGIDQELACAELATRP